MNEMMVGFSITTSLFQPSLSLSLPSNFPSSSPSFLFPKPKQPLLLFASNNNNNNNNGDLKKKEEEQGNNGSNGQQDNVNNNNNNDPIKPKKNLFFSLNWSALLDPEPDNILAIGLAGVLTWASVQVLLQLLFISFAIVVAALKYSFIAALLLFILITLL